MFYSEVNNNEIDKEYLNNIFVNNLIKIKSNSKNVFRTLAVASSILLPSKSKNLFIFATFFYDLTF